MTRRVADQGMQALAITDHGSMYGVIPFYAAAKKAGIKPIIGVEAYVAPRGMTDKQGKQDADYHHMILLAKNDVGYRYAPLRPVDLTATLPRDRASVRSMRGRW